MEKAVKLTNLKKIDETSVKVLKEVSEQLGDKEGRVSYPLICKRLDLSWNAVSRSIDRMVADGLIERRNGNLSVKNAVVTV